MRNVRLFKSHLRDKYKTMRMNMNRDVKKIMDDKISNKIIDLTEYKNSEKVLTYISKDIEVSTLEIIKDAWRKNKNVGAPRCNIQEKSMQFYCINSFDDLEKCTFGLYEPASDKCGVIKDFSNSICIVPGFCFDSFGYRLGYGYGYYDRFLPEFKGSKIGICYSEYIKFKLPRGIYDKPVDILVTDKYTKNMCKRLDM